MEKILQIKEGKRTELIVSHKDKTLTFIYPLIGIGSNYYVGLDNNYDYVNMAEQISRLGLERPTMAETVSLINVAYAARKNRDNKYSQEIIDILISSRLRTFTAILYVSNEGAYIEDNPQIKNKKVSMNKSDLVKKLESNDESVRFVPFGYKTGEQSAEELSKNPFVIGLVGEEGAEKLGKIASEYGSNPKVRSLNEVDEEKIRVSAITSYAEPSGGFLFRLGCGLTVDGNDFEFIPYGFAFGIDRK